MLDRTIGIIGAGNMAEALLRGAFDAGILMPARCLVTNRSNDDRLARLGREWAVRTTRDKALLMTESDVLILAVKPHDMSAVLSEIAPHAAGRHATPDHLTIARALFEAVGWVGVVPEPLLDVVTAVSGSGPAYVYALAEAMVNSGERAGLPPDLARIIVAQTVFGAGKMLTETGDGPGVLRERVTSPGGTTMAGLEALEQGGLGAAVDAAVTRAARRARELRDGPIQTPP